MNRLKVAMIETFLSLHQRGWSNRRIARELGVDRDAVSRHVRQFRAAAKAAKVITGSEDPSEDSKAAKVIIAGRKRVDKVVTAPSHASR